MAARFVYSGVVPAAREGEKKVIFEVGPYRIDIDVEKTRAFYERAAKITENCRCSGCRNYEAWAEKLSEEPKGVMEKMGVCSEKPAEIFVNDLNDDGSAFYGGFYHLCGRILAGRRSSWNASKQCWDISDLSFGELGKGYRAAFTEDIDLLEDGFPEPVIQMEILADIPWLLKGEACF